METITNKINDSNILKLIQKPEDLSLVQVVSPTFKKKSVKLSSLLAGSISSEQADTIKKELKQIRNLWD